MKIKWGMMMTDGRGKLGGQVASKNRAGAYVRTKVTPSNPQTGSQSVVRSLFGILSKNWGTLDEATRQVWNRAADSGLFAKTNVFGDTVRHSGKGLYTSINSLARLHQGINFTTPPLFSAVFVEQGADISATLEITEERDIFKLGITHDLVNDLPLGAVLQIQATAPLSAGISNFTSRYRDIVSISFATVNNTDELDIKAPYTEKFGSDIPLGSKVGIRFRQIVDGQASPWVATSAIAEESQS